MKPDAEAHRASFGSENAQTAAGFTNPREPARVFNRDGLVEVKQTAVDVCEGMNFRSVPEIKLQTSRREARASRKLATKGVNAGSRRSRNDPSGRHCDWNHIERVLQREAVVCR